MVSFRTAIAEADKLRIDHGYSISQPVNVFDMCVAMKISLRFIDISMEGMYTIGENGSNPTIIISNQRPLPRRAFTCAHELGHHIFKHGNRIDELSDNEFASDREEEALVDTFAAALLMPVIGIQAEFSKRSLNFGTATASHFYTISSAFGVGYSSMVTNCKIHKLISPKKSLELLKLTPAKLFKSITGQDTKAAHFKIIDGYSQLPVIDLEVSDYIVLPTNSKVEGNHLIEHSRTTFGVVFNAVHAGIVRVMYKENASFIRIQNTRYTGLAEYRHLEN